MHNSPEKYYFCDKLRFDIASFLFNNLIFVDLSKEGYLYIVWFAKSWLLPRALILAEVKYFPRVVYYGGQAYW